MTHRSDPSDVILIDDIEKGLHPKAQIEAVRVLRSIVEQGETQLVVSTHSPYVVDEVEAEHVWVIAPAEDGAPRAGRLTEHPEADRALDVLTAGELWTSRDESWVTKAS